MTWSAFFKSNSFKYGFCTGATGLALGGGGTVILSLNIASKCSAVVNQIVSVTSEDIYIPELKAVYSIRNFSETITLHDISAPFPSSLTDTINQLNEVPGYCFAVTMTIGFCLTIAISLALASIIAVMVHNKPLDENEDTERRYLSLSSDA